MVVGSWRDGFRRVLQAPAVLAGVFAVTLVTAAPLALTLRGAIEAHLGRSLAADVAADGVNYDWWQEFSSQAAGFGTGLGTTSLATTALGSTFSPSIIGFAATLDNISSVLEAQPEIIPVAAALAAYLLVWTFLSGGILDRYARQRPTRAHGFFAASGVFFWRFLRLALIAGAAYGFLFSWVHAWLFDDLYTRLTRDLATEPVAFLWRVALYAVFGAALVAVNITVDYARIRMVVEDRRSVVGALSATLRFLGRHPGRAFGLYALNGLVFLLSIAVWALAAPRAAGMGLSMWLGVAATQLHLLARLLLKLQFMASQTALFQQSLAHAGYTAAPLPVWPESPAAEAIVGGK
ncbi:MAG: hypothetical protein EXQ53_11040 [Acidobacteria bacterium]|nr:hypothetical protein [Acidobacteriota bacterium]